jgi:hypothetical protein
MSSKYGASIVGGLFGGVVFGMTMQMMMAPTPEGGQMPVIAMIGQIVGSPSVGIGWAYHLFNSAVIGAMFGWLFGDQVHNYSSALGWGAAYGLAWWIAGGLILMPVLLGMLPFAPLVMAPMRIIAVGSLVGHLIYGLILGGTFAWLYHGVHQHGVPARA